MNDLIDRYIHQVSRKLPADTREDVALELRATIDDMVDARDDHSPDGVRDALTELGDPQGLADQYRGTPRYLIGPEYFDAYVKIVRIVLLTALPVVFGAQILAYLLEDDRGVLSVVGHALWGTAGTAVLILFWTTVVFAVIDRSGMSLDEATGRTPNSWTPDDLPELPPERQISRGDVIASVVLVLMIPVALVWQHLRSPFSNDDGPIPLLDPDLWSRWFPILFGILAVNLAIEAWKYAAGRWTLSLVLVNLALNIAFVGWFVALFANERVWNPDYVTALAEETDFVLDGSVVEPITIAVVVVIAVWDVVDSVVKHVRRPERSVVA